MLKIKKSKKSVRRILPIAAAAAIVTVAFPASSSINAESRDINSVSEVPIYELSMSDTNPSNTLKEAVIQNVIESNANLDSSMIDVEKSSINITGLNRSKAGLQTVTLKISLAVTDDENASKKSVGYDYTEDAVVNLLKSTAPQLKLKADEVTVNNGDVFKACNYISYIYDDSGVLPVWTSAGEVDTSTDGDYYVTYTAVDLEGNKTTADLTVHVRTPEEVLEAQRLAEEEAARLAEEEAQRQAEEEARQKEEEERAAALAAANASTDDTSTTSYYSAGTGTPVSGSGYNPYYGGWSNCTSGAWMATYANTGVALPSLGNAGSWLYNASAYGYATGSTPAVGSVAVYSHHVAYVAAVDGDMVYIIEGGYNGGYNERWVSAYGTGTQANLGYIYVGG